MSHGLEEAARRLAGSKGNPPRLVDEEPTFDREPTGNWAPGTPPVLQHRCHRDLAATAESTTSAKSAGPRAAASDGDATSRRSRRNPFVGRRPAYHVSAPSNPSCASRRSRAGSGSGKTRPPPSGHRERHSATRRDRARSRPSCGSGCRRRCPRSSAAGRSYVPPEFQIDAGERRVLNALGEPVDGPRERSASCSMSLTRSRSWRA